MVKTKKAGFLTKLVILALLIYMATSLLNLQGQLHDAKMQQETLSVQVAAQKQENADLADAVENNNDPERIQEIAREKLGLVAPGEKVFVITN